MPLLGFNKFIKAILTILKCKNAADISSLKLVFVGLVETDQDQIRSSTNYQLRAESIVNMYEYKEHMQFNKHLLYYQQMITRRQFSHRENTENF